MAAKQANRDIEDEEDVDPSALEAKPKKAPKGQKPSKEPKAPKEKKTRKEKKQGNKVVPILLGLVLIGGISALIFFNLFSVRTKYVLPIVEKIPIVNNLVKAPEATTDDPYANATHAELVAKINELEGTISTMTVAQTEMEEKNALNVADIDRLQKVEAQQLQNKADKDAFDAMIAAKDPAAYAAFYASIAPTNVEALGQEALAKVQQTKDFKKYMSTLQAVDESEGAKILEQLVKTDMDLVVTIMQNLDSDKSGAILTVMETKAAASVVKRMALPKP